MTLEDHRTGICRLLQLGLPGVPFLSPRSRGSPHLLSAVLFPASSDAVSRHQRCTLSLLKVDGSAFSHVAFSLFSSKHFLIPSPFRLYPFPLRTVLLNFQIVGDFPSFMLELTFILIPLWPETILIFKILVFGTCRPLFMVHHMNNVSKFSVRI